MRLRGRIFQILQYAEAGTHFGQEQNHTTSDTPCRSPFRYGAAVSAGLANSYFTYDLAGNAIQIQDLWGIHGIQYDNASRPSVYQYPNGSIIYYSYDSGSDLVVLTYPGSSGALLAGYDASQRQTVVRSPSGASTYFSYDCFQHVRSTVYGNGATFASTYDAAARLSKWRYTNSSGAAIAYFDYSRDAKGLIIQALRESSYAIYYSYDASDRLTSEIWAAAGVPSNEVYGYRYAYDLAGNRIRSLINGAATYYSYDQANQLKVLASTSAWSNPTYYLYDRNGSVTNVISPSGATYFAYNPAGLIARMRWADSSATYFFYDGNLRRYSMVAAGTATYFLWDGPNLLQELNANGTVKEEHTNAVTAVSGIGQLLETNRPGASPQKLYPVMDSRGSITKYLQSDGVTIFASREYDAFGNLIPNSAVGTWPGRFGYQGQTWQELVSANGSQRMLLSPTRLYDPVIGRFLKNDPLNSGDPIALGMMRSRVAGSATYKRSGRFMTSPSGLVSEGCASDVKTGGFTRTCGGDQRGAGWHTRQLPSATCPQCGLPRGRQEEFTYVLNQPLSELVDPSGLAVLAPPVPGGLGGWGPSSITTPAGLAIMTELGLIGVGASVAVGVGVASLPPSNCQPPIFRTILTIATIPIVIVVAAVAIKTAACRCQFSGGWDTPDSLGPGGISLEQLKKQRGYLTKDQCKRVCDTQGVGGAEWGGKPI